MKLLVGQLFWSSTALSGSISDLISELSPRQTEKAIKEHTGLDETKNPNNPILHLLQEKLSLALLSFKLVGCQVIERFLWEKLGKNSFDLDHLETKQEKIHIFQENTNIMDIDDKCSDYCINTDIWQWKTCV